MSVRLVVGDTVLRPYFEGVSQRPHTLRWRAHRPDCRYATGDDLETLATMVEVGGIENARHMVIREIIKPCRTCKPVLLVEEPADA